MAKRRQSKGFRRAARMTFPLAVAAGFAVPLGGAIAAGRTAGITGPNGAISTFSRSMVGIDPYNPGSGWHMSELTKGLWPVVAGLVVHKIFGSWLGINRQLAASRIPFIRL